MSWGRLWVALWAFAWLLIGCERPAEQQRPQATAPSPSATSAKSAPPPPFELWLGGDVHLGHRLRDNGADKRLELLRLRGQLEGMGFVNLEGPVAVADPAGPAAAQRQIRKIPDAGTFRPRLANAPEALGMLRDAGVKWVGIANNHALDGGESGTRFTVTQLRQRGFVAVGGLASVGRLDLPSGRLAWTAHDLSNRLPVDLRAELSRARQQADVLVATFHVTGPPSYLPGPVLRQAVQHALQAGANVVAAHGSHALAAVERRGQQVVAWGLGNLLFECDCTGEKDGLILKVSIAAGAVDARIVPIEAGLRGKPAQLAADPKLIFDLLEALGSSPLERKAREAAF